jgi:hypothetical protein
LRGGKRVVVVGDVGRHGPTPCPGARRHGAAPRHPAGPSSTRRGHATARGHTAPRYDGGGAARRRGCRKDEKLQRVCLAPGLSLRGYEALYIAEPVAEVPKLNPDGKENLEWARGVLREELAAAIREKGLFGTVAVREAEVAPGGKTLRLESTIVEYEKGGGGARWFAGLYGSGQPVIKVRGRLLDGDRQVLLFETRRSGVGGKARWLGGYMSDKDIQTNDIKDLVGALAEFMTAPR